MARELEMDIAYQQVVGIARRLEGMLTQDREEREAKRSRESGTYSGTRAPATARQGRGYMGCPVHSALPAASGAPTTTRPQDPYYAPSVSIVPSIWGDSSGQSSRSGPSQSQQPRPPRAYFECDDTRHLVRNCPRFRRGAPPRISQAPCAPPGAQDMVTTSATTPPAQPARGGGRPRGGGQARYYALPARTEAVTSDFVIIGIVPVCHRDASVLFDPDSTYSYVSSYFASYFGVSRYSPSSPVNFISLFWRAVQSELGTRVELSIVFHPQTDGQSERTIQILDDMLGACVIDFGGA
ncbi:uncharacterized protein [Nicotiana tomentosiformis]|uniref:uncharacterized protein n=1 Tax=Nicotiana tomentosiformis TaxID=4098 RepID=UPI00388C4417